jgi:hypothetical protein
MKEAGKYELTAHSKVGCRRWRKMVVGGVDRGRKVEGTRSKPLTIGGSGGRRQKHQAQIRTMDGSVVKREEREGREGAKNFGENFLEEERNGDG